MIYSPWFSNLLAWTFFRWWGLWACDQWYRAHFSWYFEEWPFHFCLQVHAFHKCDSLWPETDNLCIIHDCHTSCDQWSFMEFFFPDQWPAETSSCIIFLWWDLLKHTWKGLGSSLPCYNLNFFCAYTASGSVPLLYWWVSTYGKRESQVIAFLEDLFNLFFVCMGAMGSTSIAYRS